MIMVLTRTSRAVVEKGPGDLGLTAFNARVHRRSSTSKRCNCSYNRSNADEGPCSPGRKHCQDSSYWVVHKDRSVSFNCSMERGKASEVSDKQVDENARLLLRISVAVDTSPAPDGSR